MCACVKGVCVSSQVYRATSSECKIAVMLLWGLKSHRAAQSKRRLPWLTSPVATGLLQQRNKSTFPHPRALVSFCSIFTPQHIQRVCVCVGVYSCETPLKTIYMTKTAALTPPTPP